MRAAVSCQHPSGELTVGGERAQAAGPPRPSGHVPAAAPELVWNGPSARREPRTRHCSAVACVALASPSCAAASHSRPANSRVMSLSDAHSACSLKEGVTLGTVAASLALARLQSASHLHHEEPAVVHPKYCVLCMGSCATPDQQLRQAAGNNGGAPPRCTSDHPRARRSFLVHRA